MPVRNFVFTLGGKPIFTCYSKEGTDGWTLFGISDPNPAGAHLSSAFAEDKIRTHVTDPKAANPHVLTRNFTPEYLAKQLAPRYKKIVQTYRPNQKAWTMTSPLKRRLARVLPRVEGDTMYLPLEVYRTEIRANFSNRNRWKRTPIRDLLVNGDTFAYVRKNGRDYLVRPIDNKHMLQMTDRSMDSFINIWAELLGYSEYIDYVADRLIPEVKRRARGIMPKARRALTF